MKCFGVALSGLVVTTRSECGREMTIIVREQHRSKEPEP